MPTLHARVERALRAVLAGLASSALTAAAFIWLKPLFAPTLSLVSRPRDSFPFWAPAALKLIESVLLFATGLENRISRYICMWLMVALDARLVGTIGIAPFLHLLSSSYSVSWQTNLLLYIIEIVALVAPLYFVATSVPPHTLYDDLQLSTYTSLLCTTFLSLPLFYLSSRFLPLTMTTYFDRTTAVHVMPLPYFLVSNIPTGFALQTLLTRYGVKGALVAFANILITGTGLMYYGLEGAQLQGVEIINGMWIVSLLVSLLATYVFVLRNWVLEFRGRSISVSRGT